MIVVRDVFQIQFGQAKAAIDLWKEGLDIARRVGYARQGRILTDLVGPNYYTLILETTFETMSDFETMSRKCMDDPAWRSWYPKVVPLTRGGHREILNLVS